ncbi:hypothetical protein HN51_005159 [Arachis hypogaea]|nr:AT-rich interactive domain-containing protein 2 [Arachis hypogaea]XP_025695471.1 AT-rich interactive domain-containing protein 2 [Arachis hypogaea]XP_025695472.1 AT-rich interactive domain-containing protein 2 [Arachis hypogaea]QHO38872.1 AT-rich interactive domain-containing protein [Arachis hypogaea]
MNTLTMGGKIIHKNYASCSFDDRDMLMLLKDLALDPCNVKPSQKRLENRILKIRKLLKASVERPKRKRKFDEYENESKLAATFGSITGEKYDIQNAKNQRKGESSCLSLHSLESWGHSAIHEDVLSSLNDCSKCCSLSKMTNPMIKWNLKSHSEDLVTNSSCTNSIATSNNDETNKEFWNDVSSEASHSMRSNKEAKELNFPRFVIPIGPRFQAEVPRWEGAATRRHNSCDDMKWLGTQAWPIPGIAKSNRMCVRKGRSDPCSCDDPGSIECVEEHINESRKRLELEIGTTFQSWKFHEMGKDVSKSWTFEEEKEFENLARSNLQSDETNFWDLAMEHFPNKTMKSMINYYYNVYIPRRLSMETRASSSAVDSDNDQSEVYKNDDGGSTTKMRIVPMCKFLKSRTKSCQVSKFKSNQVGT